MAQLDGFATATEMLAALRRRSVSARELIELHLRRIARHNPSVNAIVIPNVDGATAAAQRADDARARGEDAPLLGLPITVKEALEVAGLRATGGIPEHAQHVSTSTAPVPARLLDAGAVLVGKTNVPPGLNGFHAANEVFGRTNNPWDLARTSGGSTGGAAAVAAGISPLEIGSDLGGSIGVPAAFCGVYGHRPSETLVPAHGHFRGSAWPNSAFPFPSVGPLARSAEDLELALDVIAGPDEGVSVAWRLELPPPRAERLTDLRVAVLRPVSWLPVRAEIAAAQDEMAHALARLGKRVGDAFPDGFGDLRPHHELLQSIYASINGARTRLERDAEAAAFRAADGPFAEARARGREAMGFEYVGWVGRREQFRAAYRDFFREWDVLLAPITLTAALPHDEPPQSNRVTHADGVALSQVLMLVYPGLAVLCGQPATTFPVGATSDGLPIGLQAIGPHLEDRTPIRFAAMIARELGVGFRRPPGFDD
jgi:amidase